MVSPVEHPDLYGHTHDVMPQDGISIPRIRDISESVQHLDIPGDGQDLAEPAAIVWPDYIGSVDGDAWTSRLLVKYVEKEIDQTYSISGMLALSSMGMAVLEQWGGRCTVHTQHGGGHILAVQSLHAQNGLDVSGVASIPTNFYKNRPLHRLKLIDKKRHIVTPLSKALRIFKGTTTLQTIWTSSTP